nr:hypothetical protein BaRGS_006317 [Batillaria attramentaria]
MNRFVEWGGNFIDTANVYGQGNSEKIVGSWLSGQERDRFVIATKVRMSMDPKNPNAVGLSRRHLTKSIDDSLKRLQTDYVDLYLGASNVTGWQLQNIVDLSKEMGLNSYIALQGPKGFLTGKVKRDQKPAEGRLGWASSANVNFQSSPSWTALNTERNWAVLETVEKIAKNKGKSPAQVSVRWLLQKSVVSSVIVGATKMHQLDDNMGAANGWELTQEENFVKMASVPEESKCQYNYLGKSGLRVSNICLGAMTFGESIVSMPFKGIPGQLDEAGAFTLMNRYVEWGGNFIDTANVYGRGNSEKIVGSWLSGQERDRFVIATKVRFPMDQGNPNAVGLSRRHITKSIDDSLKRLQTDYVDLFQTHLWDDAVPLEETLLTLNDLVRCGKVRYLGASNVTGWQLQNIVDLTKEMGLNPYISLQQQYNLVSRESELEPFQVCKLRGIGVLPWSPLKGGFLTGKVKRDQKPAEGRLGWSSSANMNLQSSPTWEALNTERNWAVLDALENIAKNKGKSPAQVSLRWLLQKSVVSSVIVGATKMHQLDDNMGAANGHVKLTGDLIGCCVL